MWKALALIGSIFLFSCIGAVALYLDQHEAVLGAMMGSLVGFGIGYGALVMSVRLDRPK